MPTRYFLSRVVTRQRGDEQVTDPAIAFASWPAGTRLRHVYRDALQGWCLTVVNNDQAGGGAVPVPNDADVIALPANATPGGTPNATQRNAIVNFLNERGVDSSWVVAGLTWRQIVLRFGRYARDDFDADGFGSF